MRSEEPRPAAVALIDDEEMTLTSLRALFQLETDFAVSCFQDPAHAVREFERNPFDVVISDYLMPKMNGLEVLRQARRCQPEAARILLTGFADKQNAITAINEIGLYQYVEKPWDNAELLFIVRHAFEEKTLRQQLAEKVKELDQLLWEHKRLSERHSYLETEMEMAGRVQQSLLPGRPPEIAGFRISTLYRPCHYLGGDFIDYVEHADKTVILVADASGHGMQAALTSMLLKASFHDAEGTSATPYELLRNMNSTLHRFLPTGMFVAAMTLWIGARGSSISLAGAGLPYPFVLRRPERRLDEIAVQGLPLGLIADVQASCYDVREVVLRPADVLLVASDGLGEIRNGAGEQFQDFGLHAALADLIGESGDDLLQTLVDQATAFGNAAPLLDDVSLLAIAKT